MTMTPTAEAARQVLTAWESRDPRGLEAAARAPYPAAEDERHEFLEALVGEIRGLERRPDPAAAHQYRRLLKHLARG
jgi:hypothetical protein